MKPSAIFCLCRLQSSAQRNQLRRSEPGSVPDTLLLPGRGSLLVSP